MSGETTQDEGLSSDIQRLVDAVASLAEATVRPAVRTLDTLGSSIGRGSGPPRIKLSGVDRAGASLLSSSIHLAERLSSLALELVAPGGLHPGGGQVLGLPSGRAGETLSIPIAVSNPGSDAMPQLRFEVVGLDGPGGSILAGTSSSTDPDTIAGVASGDFEKITLRVEIPVGATPGTYEGALRVHGDGVRPFEIPFRFALVS